MPGKIRAITLQPKPTRILHFWRVAIHLLVFLLILLAPLIAWHKLLLILLLSLHGYLSFRQVRKQSGKQVVTARITPDGRSRLTMGDGRKLLARVRHDTVVTPWVTLLRFDLDRGWFHPTLVLTSDILSEEEMRQLRVLLRFSQFNSNDASDGR